MKKCSANGARNKGDFCILRWYFLHFYINAFHVYIFPVTSVWITEHCSGDDIWRQGETATRSRQSINQRKIIRNTLGPPLPLEFTPPPVPQPAPRCNCRRVGISECGTDVARGTQKMGDFNISGSRINKEQTASEATRMWRYDGDSKLNKILCLTLLFYGFFYLGRVGREGLRKSLTKPRPSKWRQQSQMNENVKAKWLTKLITTKLQIAQINLILSEFVFLSCCCFQCQWVEWLVSGQSFDSFSALGSTAICLGALCLFVSLFLC